MEQYETPLSIIRGVCKLYGIKFSDFRKSKYYKKWCQLNRKTYKYIDNTIIRVRRKAKTKDVRLTKDYYVHSCFLALYIFPCYRIFTQYSLYSLERSKSKYNYPSYKDIYKAISRGSGLYGGFPSFFIGYSLSFAPFFLNSFCNQENGYFLFFFFHFSSLALAYPFVLNSNYRACNSEKFVHLKSFKQIFSLMFNRKFYFGFASYFNANVKLFMPIYNLTAYKHEYYRIALVCEHTIKDTNKSAKELEKYLFVDKSFKPYGRMYFNIFPIILNYYYLYQLNLLICFYDRASRYVNLFRKDDAARYRKAMQVKYPPKKHDRMLNDWNKILGEEDEKYIKPYFEDD